MRVVSSERFVAYIEKHAGDRTFAVVTIHPRPDGDRYGVDFTRTLACYETLARGASKSARRDIRKLEKEAR